MVENYALKSNALVRTDAPVLVYGPPMARSYCPRIGLIGCGGITEQHLKAYRASGWEVAAFYNPTQAKAEQRRDEFYPNAIVCPSVEELLEISGIDVVDIATHPAVRGALIAQAVASGKHVLSQKPFAVDLAEGTRLEPVTK